jgi:hypothetical protein
VTKISAPEGMKKSKSKDERKYPLSSANIVLANIGGPLCPLVSES